MTLLREITSQLMVSAAVASAMLSSAAAQRPFESSIWLAVCSSNVLTESGMRTPPPGAGVCASPMIFGNELVSQPPAPGDFADDRPAYACNGQRFQGKFRVEGCRLGQPFASGSGFRVKCNGAGLHRNDGN